MSTIYGYELILDLEQCDVKKFTRHHIRKYCEGLCKLIGMERCKLIFWDDKWVPKRYKQTSPHTEGTSAVQFIITSSIVIHCLDQLEAAFINIFSCRVFNEGDAQKFSQDFFDAKKVGAHFIKRWTITTGEE
jgi:S-adenosylmethionine/arginine decarboxylase-like enzyme